MPSYLSGLAGLVPLLVVYVLWRLYVVRRKFRMGEAVSTLHEAGCLLLALFLLELATVSFAPIDFAMLGTGTHPIKVNPLPLSTIGPVLAQEELSLPVRVMAIASPYLAYTATGLLFPLVIERLASYRRTVSVSALIAIGIELAQLVETTLGVSVKTFAFDDVLFSCIAASVGYGVFVLARSLIRRYNPDFRRLDFYEPEDGEAWDDVDEWAPFEDDGNLEYLDEEFEDEAI